MTTTPQRLLLQSGAIYTPDRPGATAMLTAGDQVVWVGDDADARAHIDGADLVVDLRGRLVTPGFVDAHVHLSKTGFALQSVDLGTASSRDEALQLIEAHAAADRGSVVFAHGWDDTTWPETGAFTAAELDVVVAGRMAYVSRVDGHSAVVSLALLASDPSIEQRDGWQGDGLVSRDAHHAARGVVDDLWTDEERSAALLLALRSAAASGLTEVHEMNAPHIAPYSDADLVASLRSRYALPEVVSYWGAMLGGDHADAPVAGFAGDLCVDGAIGSRTAAVSAPYADDDSDGFLYLDSESVHTHVLGCADRGLQAGFHVIGDRAVETVLRGFRTNRQIGRHRGLLGSGFGTLADDGRVRCGQDGAMTLLAHDEPPPVETLNPGGASNLFLIADHAGCASLRPSARWAWMKRNEGAISAGTSASPASPATLPRPSMHRR